VVVAFAVFSWALVPSTTLADHVQISAAVAASGERFSDDTWKIEVTWSVTCQGAESGASYTGSLSLIDEDGQSYYMGGVSSASGTSTQLVGRLATPRRLSPLLKVSCWSNANLHGAGPIEVLGGGVEVPARGNDGGGGAGGGAGGAGTGGAGGAPDGLPGGACAREIRGTGGGETIVGTGQNETIRALGGDDVIRARAGHDCLYGGTGNDRLEGEGGSDGLYGGGGADTLIGGPGVNVYQAGPGDDVVRAANGRAETVRCGAGRDEVAADRDDRLSGCERVVRIG
jgi:Ca2+-binding RTX toxin-like protein